jgi:hypothetical protein
MYKTIYLELHKENNEKYNKFIISIDEKRNIQIENTVFH